MQLVKISDIPAYATSTLTTNHSTRDVVTIKFCDDGSTSLHDLAARYDREIVFAKDCTVAVVLAAFYGGKGYTTHKTIESAIKASNAVSDYSHSIIDKNGETFIVDY